MRKVDEDRRRADEEFRKHIQEEERKKKDVENKADAEQLAILEQAGQDPAMQKAIAQVMSRRIISVKLKNVFF